ncbi:putative armadillo-like helical, SWI/SNF-like complex subunit BAF250/Osa protein [Helianthus debilis subsp. tardiflorus]
MVQHRHCLETIFQCMEDHATEDEELVTNCLETIVNLAPMLDLRIFSSSKPSYIKITEKHAVKAIFGILGSSIKAWHCAATELLGRVIINPDNEPFLLPSASQIYKRLVDLLSLPAVDAQAAAVGALYNLAEVNINSQLKLASERWVVDRLLKVIKTPHLVPEVCRKATMILESLVSEPQNRLNIVRVNIKAQIEMQKRELGKQGGGSGGSGTPAAKRGRPVGSTANNLAAAALAEAATASTLLGPSLQIHSSFADQNTKRIVLALQSGLKSELAWALNALTLLSFKEKDEVRKDATPLAKIPGLLDALLQVIDDWRYIALPKELVKTPRTRSLGVNTIVTGFGNDIPHTNIGSSSVSEVTLQKKVTKAHPSEWWLAEDSLFNLDDEGRAEKQLCLVAASNILRNFSFMPEIPSW